MRARVLGAAATAAVLAAALTGCGANQKVEKDENGLLPVKIGYTAPGAGYSDLYDGVDYGIFKKHGLDVTLTRLHDSSQLVPALASGSVQIGVGVGPDSAASIIEGAKLRYVAISEAHYNLEMWVAPDVKTFADLKGKKVGLTSPGSEGDFGLTELLRKHGMKRSDVQGTFLKSVPAEIAALRSGAVSAILTQPPQGASSQGNGAHRLTHMSDMTYPTGTYTIQASFLEKNTEVLKKFYAAEAESLRFVRTHKSQTVAAIQKYTGVTNPKLAAYAYEFFLDVWQKDPAVDPRLIRQAFTMAAEESDKKPPSDVSKYIVTGLDS